MKASAWYTSKLMEQSGWATRKNNLEAKSRGLFDYYYYFCKQGHCIYLNKFDYLRKILNFSATMSVKYKHMEETVILLQCIIQCRQNTNMRLNWIIKTYTKRQTWEVRPQLTETISLRLIGSLDIFILTVSEDVQIISSYVVLNLYLPVLNAPLLSF